ncbi:MAG: N-6 DNA methylase [Acidobacteriia bacterium]|nr:N-6 DNA methylase [Terriglobia bacterium]
MSALNLKPTHAPVKAYYAALNQFGQLHFDNEAQVSDAFAKLLTDCGRKLHLTFIHQFPIQRAKSRVIVDGALLDTFHLAHGYWEAKDEKDDLDHEIKAKLDKGYPRDNIIFQAPERAVLYQAGARIADQDISKPDYLAQIVNQFFDYKADYIQEWEQAVSEFSERIPELAAAVKKIIDEERRRNPAFVRSFDDFYALCRQAINPNLSEDAVERMLIQHLLTERIFERIFDNPDFTRRNVVAAEIEKVIVELTKRAFNRNEFLRPLDRFYKAIEVSAENTTGFSEKQAFLNTVYERFFQGYSPKEADTHGIVYTPQPIVNFMVRSVEEILQEEFGRSLGDKGVHILDPFVGTGNFIVNIMDKIKTTDLPYKYENELHCNEVMLLPYYIASMNIEHAYFDRTGEYKAFPGICLVDTFELAEAEQASLGFMNEENAQRVKRQKGSPIFVVIGNPPYNAGQVDETDNNKNRKYPVIDRRVSETYGRDSKATLLRKLQDPYLKAIRWATDRIGIEGIVCFVTNNSFIDDRSLDGVRASLGWDFEEMYVLDLGGNVRKNPKLSGTTHNVFGIQVGVSVNIFVRRAGGPKDVCCPIHYASVGPSWRKEQKYDFLTSTGAIGGVAWRELQPDEAHTWMTEGICQDFGTHIALVAKGSETIFALSSLGVSTNRDSVVYAFDERTLEERVRAFVDDYDVEVARYQQAGEPENIDEFLQKSEMKWSESLKAKLSRGTLARYSNDSIRSALYRPYSKMFLYYDAVLNDRPAQYRHIIPTPSNTDVNRAICITGPGSEKPFLSLMAAATVDLHLVGPGCGTQVFPFYTYAEDGADRRENITDWALEQFRVRYRDRSITKWDIFHYIYAVLHHPDYRQRYAANLRRELPRIPFASASSASPVVKDSDLFKALAKAGQRLAEIHVHYEQQPEYPLTKREKAGEKLDYRVTKTKLSKDKTSLIYNQFLTLSGIPKETYEYRLGNRSALEWVIDQYQVSTDKRSGITNDPNRPDDPQYILRLIGQVVTVSLETVKIVAALPSLGLPHEAD